MRDTLRKLKLLTDVTFELPIDRRSFSERLAQQVDQGYTGFFQSPFEAFSGSRNRYVGSVTSHHFKIRKRRKLFQRSASSAVAEGTFSSKNESVIVHCTITAYYNMLIPFLALLIVLYTFGIGFIMFSDMEPSLRITFIPFLIIHAALMVGIPYMTLRRSVSNLKEDIERDLYFLTKAS